MVGKREAVTLNATASDLDMDALTLSWAQVAGPPVDLVQANTTSPSFTPLSAGVYAFEATVDDGWGGIANDTVFITAQNFAPMAVLLVDRLEVAAGAQLTFDGSLSTDPDGRIVRLAFDYGDGIRENGIELVRTHRYTEAGMYRVTLWVIDDDSAQGMAQISVLIVAVPPEVVAGVNWKPLVALVFAAVLAFAGLWASRLRPLRTRGQGSVAGAFLIVSAPFVAAELGTGVASAVTGALAIPPGFGAGTFVDVGILLSGIMVALAWARRPYELKVPSALS
jgi:hypothetical protein